MASVRSIDEKRGAQAYNHHEEGSGTINYEECATKDVTSDVRELTLASAGNSGPLHRFLAAPEINSLLRGFAVIDNAAKELERQITTTALPVVPQELMNALDEAVLKAAAVTAACHPAPAVPLQHSTQLSTWSVPNDILIVSLLEEGVLEERDNVAATAVATAYNNAQQRVAVQEALARQRVETEFRAAQARTNSANAIAMTQLASRRQEIISAFASLQAKLLAAIATNASRLRAVTGPLVSAASLARGAPILFDVASTSEPIAMRIDVRMLTGAAHRLPPGVYTLRATLTEGVDGGVLRWLKAGGESLDSWEIRHPQIISIHVSSVPGTSTGNINFPAMTSLWLLLPPLANTCRDGWWARQQSLQLKHCVVLELIRMPSPKSRHQPACDDGCEQKQEHDTDVSHNDHVPEQRRRHWANLRRRHAVAPDVAHSMGTEASTVDITTHNQQALLPIVPLQDNKRGSSQRHATEMNEALRVQTRHCRSSSVENSVVGWAAFPAADLTANPVQGALRLPMLSGTRDPAVETFADILSFAQMENAWLGNIYCAVTAAPVPLSDFVSTSLTSYSTQSGGRMPADQITGTAPTRFTIGFDPANVRVVPEGPIIGLPQPITQTMEISTRIVLADTGVAPMEAPHITAAKAWPSDHQQQIALLGCSGKSIITAVQAASRKSDALYRCIESSHVAENRIELLEGAGATANALAMDVDFGTASNSGISHMASDCWADGLPTLCAKRLSHNETDCSTEGYSYDLTKTFNSNGIVTSSASSGARISAPAVVMLRANLALIAEELAGVLLLKCRRKSVIDDTALHDMSLRQWLRVLAAYTPASSTLFGAVLLTTSLWLRVFVHYASQYAVLLGVLHVPVYSFTPFPVTCVLAYNTAALPVEYAMLVVAAGPLGPLMLFAATMAAQAGMHVLLETLPTCCGTNSSSTQFTRRNRLGAGSRSGGGALWVVSRWTACLGVGAVLDPWLVILVDVCLRRYKCMSVSSSCAALQVATDGLLRSASLTAGDDGVDAGSCSCSGADAWILSSAFGASGDSGATVGAVTTIILYIVTTTIAAVLLAWFFVGWHRSGAVQDAIERRVLLGGDQCIPHDNAVSLGELMADIADLCGDTTALYCGFARDSTKPYVIVRKQGVGELLHSEDAARDVVVPEDTLAGASEMPVPATNAQIPCLQTLAAQQREGHCSGWTPSAVLRSLRRGNTRRATSEAHVTHFYVVTTRCGSIAPEVLPQRGHEMSSGANGHIADQPGETQTRPASISAPPTSIHNQVHLLRHFIAWPDGSLTRIATLK